MTQAKLLLSGLLATAQLALLAYAATHGDGGSCPNPHVRPPNIILIMTDDQDLHLDSLSYQPAVHEHFSTKGTWFRKHFCTVSQCCPSRVSLLTGKAAHNTNVTDVIPPYGGYTKFISEGHNDNYLPVWLQEAGYNTYYAGKLMNDHSIITYNKPFAKGFTRSEFLLDPGTYIYYNASTSIDNGPYNFYPGNYSTDMVAARAVEFLGEAFKADKPFFLGVMPIGPHSQTVQNGAGLPTFEAPVPAKRHSHLFPFAKVPRSPSFNPDTPGVASYLKHIPKLNASQIEYNDYYYRRRLQSLQAVNELIDTVMAKLGANPDVAANTYVFYTSDNGYHIGQHRLPPGKTCNIEEDVGVPFFARGPGIAAGKIVDFPTSHTDLAPTLFDLAGIPLRDDFDGEPIPLTEARQRSQEVKSEHVNIEFWGGNLPEGTATTGAVIGTMMQGNTYKTVRVIGNDYDLMYAVWCTADHELYNMKDDPFQMHSLYSRTGKTAGFDITKLSSRLDGLLLTLKSCKGKVCTRPWATLFPDGSVKNLRDAMAPKYDYFFLYQQANVTFSACSKGYIPATEGATKPVIYGGSMEDAKFEARWEDMT